MISSISTFGRLNCLQLPAFPILESMNTKSASQRNSIPLMEILTCCIPYSYIRSIIMLFLWDDEISFKWNQESGFEQNQEPGLQESRLLASPNTQYQIPNTLY